MFNTLMKTMFGSSNDRYVKSIGKIVDQINALEPQLQEGTSLELYTRKGAGVTLRVAATMGGGILPGD